MRREGDRRPRVGLVLASLHTGASLDVWPSVAAAAERADADLFCFPGGRIGLREGHEASRNAVYEVAARVPLDGLLIWASSLSGTAGEEAVDAFIDRFRGTPAVSLSTGPKNLPIVTIDYYQGMRDALRHVIEVHGYRTIAFIRGPELHPGAGERYRAYLDTLKDFGISFDERLVSPPHPWDGGREAALSLLDGRNLVPGRDFRALVASSDLQALWAAKTMQARGYQIPEDVAVIGMNDSVESRLATPPLTTVDGPFGELATMGFETLMDRIAGKSVPEIRKLRASLVVRQSCGCPSGSFQHAGSIGLETDDAGALGTPAELSKKIGDDLGLERELARDWVLPLVDAWNDAIASGRSERFFDILDRIIDRVIRGGMEVAPWQGAVSSLRRAALRRLDREAGEPSSRDPDGRDPATRSLATRGRLEDLAGQARILVAEGSERALVYRSWEEGRRADELKRLDRELLMAFDLRRLAETLRSGLPALGIRSAYLCRYEGEEGAEQANLVFGLRDGTEVSDPSLSFPVSDLVPLEVLPDRRLAFIVEPLFFHDSPIGYALFEIGPRAGSIYEGLRDSIGNALRSVILVSRLEDARARAEKADETKTRLLSNVSHELRTPVNLILSSVDRLSSGPAAEALCDTEREAELAKIRANAEHQRRLVNDLLDLSRAEIDELDINRILCDPKPILEEAFAAVAAPPGGEVAWRLVSPDRLPFVRADPFRLRQVLLNLLGNARKFTERGSVTLEVEIAPPRLVVSVRDTGPGIPASRLANVFEPFASSNQGGVGLGLSIARHLALLHFGTLEAESVEGRGATFRLALPLPNLEGLTIPTAGPDSGCVIDVSTGDDALRGIETLADRAGLAVRVMSLAEAEAGALDCVRPSAIAWDVGRAGAREWSLFRKIRQHPRLMALPFLLFGAGGAANAETGAGEGLVGFLSKGESEKSLAETIMLSCPQGGDEPILVADDDPAALESLRDGLAKAFPDFEIVTARDGEEAWEAVRARKPRAAIIDLVMPGLGGIELVERMRRDERLYSIPVILLTAKVIGLEDVRALEAHSRVLLQNKGIWRDEELGRGVSRLLFGSGSLPAPTSALVKRTIAFLNRHYRENVTRWKLAEAVNLSEDYVSRIFHRELGLTPWDYLARLRVQKAKELLMGGSDSIAIVGEKVGFDDQAYFSRVFKKIAGVSPQAFREAPDGRKRR